MPKTVSQILTEAGDLVAAHWYQGAMLRTVADYSCYCAAGAIRQALTGTPRLPADNDTLDTYAAALSALRDGANIVPFDDPEGESRSDFENPECDVIDWNDHGSRTQAEVVDAFRKAAELAAA